MRRGAVAVGLAACGLVAVAPPVAAVPILDPEDAEELAQALAEATEEQDICYGWSVVVDDYSGGSGGTDQGSSLGVGRLPNDDGCDRYVAFVARLVYTSESSESEDSAAFEVRSNVPGAPTESDLRRVGVSGAALLGSDDDAVLANAVLALPALVAESGLAPAITLEPNRAPIPEADVATGRPGSDWMRKYGALLATAVLVMAAGLGWTGWILYHDRPFAPKGRTRRLRGLPQ